MTIEYGPSKMAKQQIMGFGVMEAAEISHFSVRSRFV